MEDPNATSLEIYWDDAWYLQDLLLDKAEEMLDAIRCGEEFTGFGESHDLPIEDELQRVVHLLGEFRALKFENCGAKPQIVDRETGELRDITEEDREKLNEELEGKLSSFKMERLVNDD